MNHDKALPFQQWPTGTSNKYEDFNLNKFKFKLIKKKCKTKVNNSILNCEEEGTTQYSVPN